MSTGSVVSVKQAKLSASQVLSIISSEIVLNICWCSTLAGMGFRLLKFWSWVQFTPKYLGENIQSPVWPATASLLFKSTAWEQDRSVTYQTRVSSSSRAAGSQPCLSQQVSNSHLTIWNSSLWPIEGAKSLAQPTNSTMQREMPSLKCRWKVPQAGSCR